MTEDEVKAEERNLQPVKLNNEQLKELDRLIDSLRKEVIFPEKEKKLISEN